MKPSIFNKVITIFPAALCVLAIRMLRPLVTIRLRSLDISRIGGFYHADWYLCGCKFQIKGKRYLDVFFLSTLNNVTCNRQWLKMWKRVLRVTPFGTFLDLVTKLSRILPNHAPHSLPMENISHRTLGNQREHLELILACKTSHIFFTPEEKTYGQKALEKLGVPANQPFVCFHARDSAYLDLVYPDRSWNYHDFRDSDINHYVDSAEELAKCGYYMIRMGAIVKDNVTFSSEAIIDYAKSGKRTDFLDIYLGANCKFFICSQTGISIVPEVFRCPLVYVNFSALEQLPVFVQNGLIIPKKLYSRKHNCFLTFREILNSGIGIFYDTKQFEHLEIDLMENTPKEITSVAMEMHHRLNGTWTVTDEDEDLQQRFWALFGPNHSKSPELRIGTKFLRENTELLS